MNFQKRNKKSITVTLLRLFMILIITVFFTECKELTNTAGDEKYQQFVDKIDSLQWTAIRVFFDSIGYGDYENDSIYELPEIDTVAFDRYLDSINAIAIALREQTPATLKNRMDEILKIQLPFNKYFSAFDKLSVEKGWKLDWAYAYDTTDESGRQKIIAVRDTVDVDKFIKRIGNGSEILEYANQNPYTHHIIIDSSAFGFFQFYIIWGADGFAKYSPGVNGCLQGLGESVYSRSKLESILATRNMNDPRSNFSDEQFEKMKEINPWPEIIMDKDFCTVRIVYFHIYGGFTEEKYKISLSFPHKIERIYSGTLVEFQSKIMY